MNAIATKCQVTVAALAVGAAAAFTPVAANAAPAVQVPAAPVQQVAGDFAEAPGDFLFFSRVVSLQLMAANIRFRSGVLERKATRLEAYAAAHPDTFFGQLAAARAARLEARRAGFGDIFFSACKGGVGIQVGPYGTVTQGPC